MYKIIYLKEKTKNLLLLGISEEGESARYTVSAALYASLGSPSRGSEIPDSLMEKIRKYDLEYRARKKALDLLSIADNNKKSLKMKLLRAGFDKELAEKVTEEMSARGYINEDRQLKRLILSEAGKKRGPKRILSFLSSKGYSIDAIKKSIASLTDSGELDFAEIKEELISLAKEKGQSYDDIKKLLYKQGF